MGMDMHSDYLVTITLLANLHISNLFLGLHPNKRRAKIYSKEYTVRCFSVK